MRRLFNPEFLNRIDDYIIFRPLRKEHIYQIIELQLERLYKRLGQQNMTLELAPSAKEFLAEKGFDEKYGARPLRRALQRYLEDPLAEEVLRGTFKEGAHIVATVDPSGKALAFSESSPEEAPALATADE
jgi:ATP-dependent Clp protease ATP-binding subunit ClpC